MKRHATTGARVTACLLAALNTPSKRHITTTTRKVDPSIIVSAKEE